MYVLTDLYREFRSIHFRDTLVEVSDHHWFLTLQTKVMDIYTRLYEDKSLRLQRVKKAYTQRTNSLVKVGLVKVSVFLLICRTTIKRPPIEPFPRGWPKLNCRIVKSTHLSNISLFLLHEAKGRVFFAVIFWIWAENKSGKRDSQLRAGAGFRVFMGMRSKKFARGIERGLGISIVTLTS